MGVTQGWFQARFGEDWSKNPALKLVVVYVCFFLFFVYVFCSLFCFVLFCFTLAG